MQEIGNVHIRFEVLETVGPDHDKTFVVEVSCDDKKLAQGSGKTKKQAEMQAAEKAIMNISKNEE